MVATMLRQVINKKEVSCKVLDPLFYYAEQHKVDLNVLITDIPYELSYLLKKRERIEWGVFCKIIANARNYFSLQEFEEMGSSFIKSGYYLVGMLPAFFLFSSNKFSRMLVSILSRSNYSMFGCITVQIEFIYVNKVRITVLINKGYEFCPEFFSISKGYWGGLGQRLGHKNFNFVMDIKDEKGIFEATWDKESLLFKAKRGLRWLFSIRKALAEFTEAHEELLNEYENLQASKKKLITQTAQLRTAYEILKSIKQSLQLIETIKVIAQTLINEAGFLSVVIELKKDLNEKKLDIKYESGDTNKNMVQLYKEILINDKNIGSICFNLNPQMYFEGTNELLDYIMPVINITIHDALILTEVTEYKERLEQMVSDRTQELMKAKDELEEANKMLRETQSAQNIFFTNISHEFRTPLTLILSPARQLSEQFNDVKLKAAMELIYRNAKKLNRLVDDLLDISKIESGELRIKACPLNLVKAVKELTLSYYSYAERKKIKFNLNSDEDDIIAFIDKSKLDQILGNILSNAFKFTPERGAIQVEIVRKDKAVEISISDTGIGIPGNRLDKIFDRFYQVDNSYTQEHQGTGIGLSLTKELIELHKGKIKVVSEEGKGSTFTIYFPLGKEHLKPDEICDQEIKEIKLIPECEEDISNMDGGKMDLENIEKESLPLLLVIEDNSDVRYYIKDNLKDDYRVIEATDGEEGWESSIKHIPDLIISDIMMPKIDGFRLCEKLKSDERTSHIPVILVTAKAAKQDKIEGYETGADEYIMKPFEPNEMKARIKNLIVQRKRLHEHFLRYGLVDIDEKNITPINQKFLRKAVDIISKHISDTSFGVDVLAKNLAISRSLLLKKTVALFGESPNELIRRIRLNKAAGLIEKKYGNISEIALEVGFSNPSYFAESFKKQFGISPSQYHHNQ